MIFIRSAQYSDLIRFSQLDSQAHVRDFFSHKSLEVHQKDFRSESIVYLGIIDELGGVIGYFILQLENDEKTINFKRILVGYDHLGVGQRAISSMEDYCKNKFEVNRIWLDLYENNHKAKHIYEKLGYKQFKNEATSPRSILYYEKWL